MLTSRVWQRNEPLAHIHGHFIEGTSSDYLKEYNENNSVLSLSFDDSPKTAVDLTTARFRMLVNSEDFARPFESKVDNNLPSERYSNIDLVMHFSEIAYSGVTDSTLAHLIHARRTFKRFYFTANYCKYYDQIASNAPLLMYRIPGSPKPGVWIDKIIKWYPVFPSNGDCNSGKETSLRQERLSFSQHLKLEFREILLEYYEMTDCFPHNLLLRLIQSAEKHIQSVIDRSLTPFQEINEVCRKCGESFQNKNDLINHHDFNGCKLPPVHRCQCGQIFMTHAEWQGHSINPSMGCAPFAWHLWRHKRSLTAYSYMCDGCQHVHGGFLRFWHHICFCPFFIAFLTGNCPQCTPQTRLDFYEAPDTQVVIGRPHSDKVGIAVVRDWVGIPDLRFNFKLAIPEEPSVKML